MPWNEHVFMILINKYAAKLTEKKNNVSKIKEAIVNFMLNFQQSSLFPSEETWKFIADFI